MSEIREQAIEAAAKALYVGVRDLPGAMPDQLAERVVDAILPLFQSRVTDEMVDRFCAALFPWYRKGPADSRKRIHMRVKANLEAALSPETPAEGR